ncbi:hypothetical protein RI367_005272 [Sorochytrium milnesiophthora]
MPASSATATVKPAQSLKQQQPADNVCIIDIRSSAQMDPLQSLVIRGMQTQSRSLPTFLLYDDKGLQLFDQITYLDEYYLTGCEIDILQQHAAELARTVPDNALIVELGAGSLRKTRLLLDALETAQKCASYYALDLMRGELEKSLRGLAGSYKFVQVAGLWGTYDDGMQFLRTCPADRRRMVWWLGSSIGNYTRDEAATFLCTLQETCLRPGDTMLVGVDRRNDAATVQTAYNDPAGVTRDFIMNGLSHINQLFSSDDDRQAALFDVSAFQYHAFYNSTDGRHEAYYKSLKPQTLNLAWEQQSVQVDLAQDELIHIEYSYKYNADEVRQLLAQSRLCTLGKWTDARRMYDLHLFEKPVASFEPLSTSALVPSLAEWQQLWKAWDMVTLHMVPTERVLEKPIDLRHPVIFYIGHIPCFCDMQIAKALALTGPLQYTEPQDYTRIFERGIDPDMQDPTQCHRHSEVPEQWPALDEILQYRDRVRTRLTQLYKEQDQHFAKRIARVLWLAFEHECMHLETLLYMLVQMPKGSLNLPTNPHILSLSTLAQSEAACSTHFISVPAQTIHVGMDDPEADDLDEDKPLPAQFGWDNEKPRRAVDVPAFHIQSRPVTVGEYHQFLRCMEEERKQCTAELMPGSWTEDGDNSLAVRTVYGPVAIDQVLDHPACVSYLQAEAYCDWLNKRNDAQGSQQSFRVPTEYELGLFYELHGHGRLRLGKGNSVSVDLGSAHPLQDLLSAVTTKTAAKFPCKTQTCAGTCGAAPTRISSGNFGLQSWMTTPASDLEGVGNCWEWTSSVFDKGDGFAVSDLYPGYSADFFDGKHNTLLGGSWATHPRIAERASFRNWYQRGYPYVFSKFRLAVSAAPTAQPHHHHHKQQR